jgi:hypothetical protein
MDVLTYKPGASQMYKSPRIANFDAVSLPLTSSKLEPLDDEVPLIVLAALHRSRAYSRALGFRGIPQRDSMRTPSTLESDPMGLGGGQSNHCR